MIIQVLRWSGPTLAMSKGHVIWLRASILLPAAPFLSTASHSSCRVTLIPIDFFRIACRWSW